MSDIDHIKEEPFFFNVVLTEPLIYVDNLINSILNKKTQKTIPFLFNALIE